MIVYVEFVIIDNFCIDLLLLYLTAKVLNRQFYWWRVCFASGVGVALAFISPYLAFNAMLAIFVKLLMGLSIVLIAFKWQNVKMLFLHFLTFMLATFLFGSTCIALFGMAGQMGLNQFLLNYSSDVPITFVLIAILFIVWTSINIYRYILQNISTAKFTYDVYLIYGKYSLATKAYLDSGNVLFDNVYLKPVIILKQSALNRLFQLQENEKIINKLKGFHLIPYKTITNEVKQLPAFILPILKVSKDNKVKEYKQMIVGVTHSNFQFNGVDLLLNAKIF